VSFGFFAIPFGSQKNAGDIPVNVIEDAFVIGGASAGAVTAVDEDGGTFSNVLGFKAYADEFGVLGSSFDVRGP
jgi:hypothetical protein